MQSPHSVPKCSTQNRHPALPIAFQIFSLPLGLRPIRLRDSTELAEVRSHGEISPRSPIDPAKRVGWRIFLGLHPIRLRRSAGGFQPCQTSLDKHDKHDNFGLMEVRMTAQALSDYQRLPLVIRSRVVGVLERLTSWPRVSGAKPLHGKWKGHFRIRTGDWRLVIKPQGQVLWVVRIDNRRDVYRD